jgi:glycosyltransferase involved in cell wall biosynthesis
LASLISVVVPTFNRKVLTDRAVESVTPSDPDKFEILVVDDQGDPPYGFSGDRNSSGVEVRVLRTRSNGGPGLARKLGVQEASSDVIAFLDSDDVFDSNWPDSLLAEVVRSSAAEREQLFIVGDAVNGSRINRKFAQLLPLLPHGLQMTGARLSAILCNPFYAQATAVSKRLCVFADDLRYCEDYLTNVMALFSAGKFVALRQTACIMNRSPGTSGGLSARQREMLAGEFRVRIMTLRSGSIPVFYRMLVPLGMLYQGIRAMLKNVVGLGR